MGAWIEMLDGGGLFAKRRVAPYMGAWIEIRAERNPGEQGRVAPYMGAWIEINPTPENFNANFGRSLHGSVD